MPFHAFGSLISVVRVFLLSLLSIALFYATLSSPSHAIDKFTGPKIPTPGWNLNNCDITVNPGQSIQSAINSASSGDTVCVKNGTYHERININKNGLRIIGQDASKTILDGRFILPSGTPKGPGKETCKEDQSEAKLGLPHTACHTYASLVDISANNVIFEGLTVTRSRGRAIRVHRKDTTLNNITISNIIVPISRESNVFVYNSDKVEISYSDLQEGAAFAQYERGGSKLNHPAAGIGLYGASNVLIKNNIVHEGWGEMILADALDSGTHSLVIQDNVFYDSMSALYFHGLKNVLFQRNILYNSVEGVEDGRRNSLTIVPSEPNFTHVQSHNIAIVNNIFANSYNNPNISSGTVTDGVYDVDVYNNVFYSRNISGPVVAFQGKIKDISVSNNVFFHHSNKETFPENLGPAQFTNPSHNCFSDNPPEQLKGPDSIYNCDPKFVGTDGKGTIPVLRRGQVQASWFQLQDNSPLIDTGTNLPIQSTNWVNKDKYVIDDYLGASRSQQNVFDIGAYEFGGTPISPAPTDTPSTWDINSDGNLNLYDFSALLFWFDYNDFDFPDLTNLLPELF